MIQSFVRPSLARLSAVGLGFAVLAVPATRAQPTAVATLVPSQSQIAFVTKQLGVPVEGTFSRFEAQVAFDPRKPAGGTVALQIDTASASLGVPQSDAELPRALWFDAAKFPKAVFQSSAIRALGGGSFEIAGRLTLKGRAQDVVVPLSIAPSGTYAVATGNFTLKRLAFRIGDGEWTDTSIVADEVQVRFKFVLAGFGPL